MSLNLKSTPTSNEIYFESNDYYSQGECDDELEKPRMTSNHENSSSSNSFIGQKERSTN